LTPGLAKSEKSMSDKLLKTVIWGASGHSTIVADILSLGDEYEVLGFLDDLSPERAGESFAGATVLGGRDRLATLKGEGVSHMALGIGDCSVRVKLAGEALAAGYALVTAIHPSAVIASDVSVGEGSVICAGVVVNTTARIGRAVIVNTSASIDHHCVIEDGAHIAPGVHLPGNVHVGSETLIGVGSTTRDGVRIGSGCVIGAGSVVIEDIPDDAVAYGNPARIVSKS